MVKIACDLQRTHRDISMNVQVRMDANVTRHLHCSVLPSPSDCTPKINLFI